MSDLHPVEAGVVPAWELRGTSGYHALAVEPASDGTVTLRLIVDYGDLGIPRRELALSGVVLDAAAVHRLGEHSRAEAQRIWDSRGATGPSWSISVAATGARLVITIGADADSEPPSLLVGGGQLSCTVELAAGGAGIDAPVGQEAWAYGTWARDSFVTDSTCLDALADAILGPSEALRR